MGLLSSYGKAFINSGSIEPLKHTIVGVFFTAYGLEARPSSHQ